LTSFACLACACRPVVSLGGFILVLIGFGGFLLLSLLLSSFGEGLAGLAELILVLLETGAFLFSFHPFAEFCFVFLALPFGEGCCRKNKEYARQYGHSSHPGTFLCSWRNILVQFIPRPWVPRIYNLPSLSSPPPF
jgi:hypothetical protein